MSRPRSIYRPVDVHVMIPEELVAEVGLVLYSPLQQRVPLGATSKFYERAIRDLLAKLKGEKNDQEPIVDGSGEPAGA